MESKINRTNIENLIRQLLIEIGEDPDREGLKDTPRRVSRYWSDFIEYEPGNVNTAFEAITTNQMVVISGIRVWSLCEHHLLPFWCDLSIGYIARKKVLGLSKFARIAHKHAHKLQLQEKLVDDIASEIERVTGSEDVAVIANGIHTCMVMRGIQTHGVMKSSVMRGIFFESQQSRNEFLTIAGNFNMK